MTNAYIPIKIYNVFIILESYLISIPKSVPALPPPPSKIYRSYHCGAVDKESNCSGLEAQVRSPAWHSGLKFPVLPQLQCKSKLRLGFLGPNAAIKKTNKTKLIVSDTNFAWEPSTHSQLHSQCLLIATGFRAAHLSNRNIIWVPSESHTRFKIF